MTCQGAPIAASYTCSSGAATYDRPVPGGATMPKVEGTQKGQAPESSFLVPNSSPIVVAADERHTLDRIRTSRLARWPPLAPDSVLCQPMTADDARYCSPGGAPNELDPLPPVPPGVVHGTASPPSVFILLRGRRYQGAGSLIPILAARNMTSYQRSNLSPTRETHQQLTIRCVLAALAGAAVATMSPQRSRAT
ncbi:hypothetical protein MAPG_00446 [Magnaporthiopsis poae ATCC 64411]|uniref:Uncharacterized protein n=1 Tax=Magnaporthiopsis poae (strain ATCC 64411 / 73-15) TaxID=644358 RepID=A0A0C4DL12_MAGP6|nr:hypothetical protein MAPG_00446 [Magnaporthiopsis poae ATCC 64411]